MSTKDDNPLAHLQDPSPEHAFEHAQRFRGLTGKEYALFSILFLLIPGACVLVSSILYYVWKKDYPKKAKQINNLGFAIVGIQVLAYCGGIYLLPRLLK